MNKDDFRELQERAFQLNELTKHPGWAYLVEQMTQRSAIRQRRVLSGKCKDQAEYLGDTGWINGVEDALTAPTFAQNLVDRTVVEDE